MMVVWAHNGRPVAMASIYPWQGKMSHEFDSSSREQTDRPRQRQSDLGARNGRGGIQGGGESPCARKDGRRRTVAAR